GAPEKVREEQAVHQHRFGPRDGLLVARHETGAGALEESLGGIRRHEVAGAEDVTHPRARTAMLDEAFQTDDLVPEPHQLATLAVRADVAEGKRTAPPHFLEQ